jgi:hypothetical protein
MRPLSLAREALVRLAWLLTITGLLVALVVPAASATQFKDEDREDPTATEEVEEDAGDDDEADRDRPESADPEDLGLVDDHEYESPQFGYAVEWSRDWDLDEFYEEPLISNNENEVDTLYLAWEDGEQFAWVIVTGQTASRGGPDADVEEWLDPDYIENQWDPEIEAEPILDDVSGDAGAVLYSVIDTENDDAQYYTMYLAIERDDYMLYLSFTSHVDFLEDAYVAVGDVLIDGEPVFQFFDWDDIEEAMDEAA